MKSESRVKGYKFGTNDWKAEYNMLLDDGVTCNDCVFVKKCCLIFGQTPYVNEGKCQFYPNRFVKNIKEGAIMTRIEDFQQYKTPTGHICTMKGELGLPLEFLSLGDYGQEKNIKADFLGLTNEINGVPHGDLLPLEKKWVITISPQYGCSMGCKFCDVPRVGPGENATYNDLINQVKSALSLHPEVKHAKRINLHYARMGEPTWNPEVISSAYTLRDYFDSLGWGFHSVVSTVMPKGNKNLENFLDRWIQLKNKFDGEAGLQLSINTTDEARRHHEMPCSHSLHEIADIMNGLLFEAVLKGRKIALNFALTDAPIDAKYLRELFSPDFFMCKLTPMHNTQAAIKNGLITDGGYDFYYPYREAEEELKAAGFDVIVFIPSKEEDESRITCGNAVLTSGNWKKPGR